jgi:hypothetical protein
MNSRRINILICILLLSVAIISGSACSMGKINAQNPGSGRTEAMRRQSTEPSTPAYKPPKRVSKDVIKTEEKPETTEKQKKKAVK